MSYQPGYPQPSPAGYPGQEHHHHHHHQQQQQPGYPGMPPPGPAPLAQQASSSNIATTGQVEGAQFRIDHRDSNSMLYVRLHPQYQIKARPGSMVAMDATVQIKGKLKFSVKKFFTGGEVRIRRVVPASGSEPGGLCTS